MKTEKLNILVTGAGGYGEQILKALYLAKGNRYYLISADSQAAYRQLNIVDHHITLPYASEPDYLDQLLAACGQHHIRALFCGCESELKKISGERSRMAGQGIFLPVNPEDVIERCLNKEETGRWLSELGFETPQFICVRSKSQLREIDWFPIVIKPSVGGGGSANVYIAQNMDEAVALCDYLGLETSTDNFLVQEYVGTPDEEYTVGVLHDMDGAYINSIAVKRLLSSQLNIRMSVPNRTNRVELGPRLVISSGISHGFVGRFPEVTEPCKIIAESLGARGPINIQCRLVNGRVMVFEINPRFSGTTSIRALAGYNEPDVLLRKHLFGEKILADATYEESLVLRSLTEKRIV